jgi:2-keto-4-pentenoate hydratase/2-oxohepta-3-ene-1,7-dioic acid hydratase in catechol pathway/pimeloyl-ACP methyl ester carboxylesterase
MRFVGYLLDGDAVLGLVDDDETIVRPVRLRDSERPVTDLVTLINDWPAIRNELVAAEDTGPDGADTADAGFGSRPLTDCVLLPPVRSDRNVICVGRNYREHATEFSRSGFDASDSGGSSAASGDAAPARPVVFTKAATCLIGAGDAIDPHLGVTAAVDYEGELAVIIGRGGRGIAAADAWDHVWGYTLFNDVTARDLQRDHKQWFLGKSLDTFGPMGPYAVTADEVDPASLRITTRVNGELRQDAPLSDLIFDIPALLATISAGMTLRPGDVIATGTPAGVGIGFDPPRYLRDGDVVSISAPGLGTLINRVAAPAPRATNDEQPTRRTGMRPVNGKDLFVEVEGSGPAVVFVHGLGGTTNFYQHQAQALAGTHTIVRFDLSGHGRSPLPGGEPVSIEGWADDIEALLDSLGIATAALVGHSMGTLIAAHFAAGRPQRVSKLALLGAVKAQPPQGKEATRTRAATVREHGMEAVADTIVAAATSERTRRDNPAAAAFVRELLFRQPAAGYAAACEALAAAADPATGDVTAPVLLIAGSEDKVSPVAVNETLVQEFGAAELHVIDGVGHWHAVEATAEVTAKLTDFLTKP